ncbi:MAG TPA: TetR/AcrR family transcriptional regulator [Solirubrobacterales bacterium]|nr:TetR/AcrR family transcriptional regulator [Solirubrobacterales bacterium]
MRALPGRQSRASADTPPASVTRSNAHADQRRRILRAVGELVGERGYGDVTVEMIVKRARVSFRTFYKHYPGKEECLLDLCESAFDSAERTVRERLAAEPEAGWADLVLLALRTLVELIAAEPVIARAVIVESPTVGPAITERYELATKALVPLFRAGRALNPRGDELPETIEDTLAGSVFWSAYQRLIVGEADELAASLPVLTELVLRTYIGQAEASRIARGGERQLEPALA